MSHSLGPKAQSLLQPAMAFFQNIMVLHISLSFHLLLFSSLHFPPTCVPFPENLYSIFKTLLKYLGDKYMTLSPLLCFSLTSSIPIESSLCIRELSTDSISNSHYITFVYVFIAPTRPGSPSSQWWYHLHFLSQVPRTVPDTHTQMFFNKQPSDKYSKPEKHRMHPFNIFPL